MKSIFFYKVGGVVLSSADSIVISMFLGLETLGKYNNYYTIIIMLFSFIQVYIDAMFAGVGNSIIEESVEKNYNDFRKMNFFHNWFVGWCSICLVCLYQTFIEVWLGSEYLFSLKVPILLAAYFYAWKMMDIVNLYKEAGGMWKYDKYRPLVASAVNLSINLALVTKLGIYGIILSTIFSIVFVILPWSSYILFKYYFKQDYKNFYVTYFKNTFIILVAGIITFYVTSFIEIENLILQLFIKGGICLLLPNIIIFMMNVKNKEFIEAEKWGRQKITNILKK